MKGELLKNMLASIMKNEWDQGWILKNVFKSNVNLSRKWFFAFICEVFWRHGIYLWGTVNKTYYLYQCTVNRIEISKLNSRFYQVCKWTIQMWTGSLDSLIICDSKESFVHKFISLLLLYNCSKKSWNTQYDFFIFSSFFEAWKPQSSFIWFILKLNAQVILQKFSFCVPRNILDIHSIISFCKEVFFWNSMMLKWL